MDEEFNENTDLEEYTRERDLVQKVKKAYKEAQQHQRNWRDDAREDFRFVAGDQWSDDEQQILRDQLRPIVTFNRVGPVVDVVTGTEVQNRQEVRYIPREQGDVKPNEVLTGAAQWVRDQCDAEDEESDAFTDCVVCGLGWTETRMDYETDEDGLIVIERVSPFEMYYDPHTKARNLGDAKWVLRVIEMEKQDLRDLWPDKADEVIAAAAMRAQDDIFDSPHITHAGDQYANTESEHGTKRKDLLRVMEYQWYERKDVYRVADPFTKQATTMDAAKFKKMEENFSGVGVQLNATRIKQREYRRAFVAGECLLEEGMNPDPKGFTYKAITGKRDHTKNTWYGLVKAMKDPQRWANKWLSQTMHVINANAKGGLLAEQDAFLNPRKAESEWSDPTSITMLKSGALSQGKIQNKPPITYPSGLDKLMEFAISSIRDVSGVSVEMLGMREGNQPGVLEWQRKQAGITILATLFDSLRRYRKEQGRTLLHFITNFISDGRLIRIVGEDGEHYIPLVRQADSTYDVIVDDAPSSPNQKEAVFAMLSDLLPGLLQAGIPVPPDIVEYAPLPSGLIEKWKDLLAKGAEGGPSPEEVAMLTEGIQVLQAENDKLKADQQAKIMKAQMDAEIRRAELEAERENDALTLAQKREMAREELELKREIAEYEITLQKMKIEADAQARAAQQFSKDSLEQQKIDLDREDRERNSQPQVVVVPGSSGKRKIRVERDADGNLVGAEMIDE